MNNKGFTLLELLISLFILTTVSTLVLSIIWISLRSTVKANNLNIIRQNGNFAMLQMTKMLQFSNEFQGVSNDGSTYILDCQSPDATSLTNYNRVKFTSADNGVTVLRCMTMPSTIASNSAYLINTSLFRLTSCNFTCTRTGEGSPYTIGFNFTISKIVSGNLFDDPAPLYLQNSVTLRNSANY